VDYISLSFVRTVDDIRTAKRVVFSHPDTKIKIIAKIETASAVKNIEGILREIDTINVDRGDLSSDIGIMKLPPTQDLLIEAALRSKKDMFLATQVLKNMENHSMPLISELVDLYRSIRKGISGVQLSEETATGKYATECVKLIFDSFEIYKISD
jgi:pyruvate kinase